MFLSVMGVPATILPEFQTTGVSDNSVVLVVDDDVLIRMDVAARLKDSGFQVIEAEDAADAIQMLESGADVRLVFSDVQMPGELDGFGLALWIKAHRPGLPVILASGVVRSQAAADALCEAAAFIEKPYRDGEIAEAARRALAAQA